MLNGIPSIENLSPSPSTGSSNPSSSLSTLWCYLLPALDHIFQSSSNSKHTPVLPITAEYYMGIHTHIYSYFGDRSNSAIGLDELYQNLDRDYADVAHQLLVDAPDENTLIHYILAKFKHYEATTAAIDRLLSHINKSYVKPAVDDGKGWFSFDDDDDIGEKYDSWGKVSWREKDRRTVELKKWGYKKGRPASVLAKAEACAEAASTPDCIVPLSSLALRRFRTEFIEPLLQLPDISHKFTEHNLPVTTKAGQLVCVKKELLETKGVGEDENQRLVAELADMLKTVGVRRSRKKHNAAH
jgi:hypothetical protein